MVGRYTLLHIDRLDADGWPMFNKENGELLKVDVRVPVPVNPLSHSTFDPTGLAPAACQHGLREHPDPAIQAGRLGRLGISWVRSRYLVTEAGAVGKCVVCMGQPRPIDLTGAPA